MGYPVSLMTLVSSTARCYYDDHLLQDTAMSSLNSFAVQLPQYCNSHNEFQSVPASETQLWDISGNNVQATDASRIDAGDYIILCQQFVP